MLENPVDWLVVMLPVIISIGLDEITDYWGLELRRIGMGHCGDLCITTYIAPGLLWVISEWKELLQSL